MARNIEISTIGKDKQTIISSSTLGITSENLQGKIIFKPVPFIEGVCRMYIKDRGTILMEREEDSYTLDILSSLLTESSLDICFKITEPENEKGIPIFCSKIIKLKVLETIDSDETIPEQYPTWIEVFDSKIAELEELEADFEEAEEDRNQAVQDAIEDIEEATAGVENLNIDVSEKVDGAVTITLTKKDGTTKAEVIRDGEKRRQR